MAIDIHTRDEGGNGNAVLSFILGALLIAVGVTGFFLWDNYKSQSGGALTTIVRVEK